MNRPSLRFVIPSPLAGISTPLPSSVRAVPPRGFGQLSKGARLGTSLLVLQFVDVVERYPTSLFQFTQAEHPAPPKLPQLRSVYLYESLHNNQHLTYYLLTIQPACESIRVS